MSRYAILEAIRGLDPENDHQRIIFLSTCYDFPFDTTRALEFALYRTFCAPRISALLDRTGEFRTRSQKRYDDTDIIVSELIEWGYDSDRGKRALGRLNEIHGRFNIANEDFLYVLSTFVYEPIRSGATWVFLFLARGGAAHVYPRHSGGLPRLRALQSGVRAATLLLHRRQSPGGHGDPRTLRQLVSEFPVPGGAVNHPCPVGRCGYRRLRVSPAVALHALAGAGGSAPAGAAGAFLAPSAAAETTHGDEASRLCRGIHHRSAWTAWNPLIFLRREKRRKSFGF